MDWNWSRGLKVVGGAAMIAGFFCFTESRTSPGYHSSLSIRYVPLPRCLLTDFPATFLVCGTVLLWMTRRR